MAKASASALFAFRVLEEAGMILFRGDLNSKFVRDQIEATVGLQLPDRCKITTADELSMAWMSPDELLIFAPPENVEHLVLDLEKSLQNASVLICEVSNSRSVIELTGDHIRDILAKNTPIDCSPEKFMKGMFRRTRLGQIAAAFWLVEESLWYIACRRSETEYVEQLLKASAQLGNLPVFYSESD